MLSLKFRAQISPQYRYFEAIQVIERNGFFADTILTSETYIGNVRFVKSF